MAPTEYRVAEHVRVVRDPNTGSPKLFIDGEEFPYLFTGDVETTTKVGLPGTVKIALLAKHISVEDRMLFEADLEPHTHEGDQE